MIAIIAHDAGGAEVLSSYVKHITTHCVFVLEGPAVQIFERKLGEVALLALEDALLVAELVLCGTSWPSDLEWRAIKMARSLGKRSIAFLEHWVNYEARFVRDGQRYLPDEIWVSDVDAEKIALKCFPDTPIQRVENPYFLELQRELATSLIPQETSEQFNILYVCEPIQEHAIKMFGHKLHKGYTEYDALHYFLSNIHVFEREKTHITVRLHPSEADGKYDEVLQAFELSTQVSRDRTLLADIASADVVVGCNTMAMVVGLLGKKRVICCIPPGGLPCSLPQIEIELLQDLICH